MTVLERLAKALFENDKKTTVASMLVGVEWPEGDTALYYEDARVFLTELKSIIEEILV